MAADIRALLPGLLGMFACFAAGLYFFMSRFPEKHWPGRFDVFSSHFIWHVFIVAAMWSWDASLQIILHRDWQCDPETA